jgi:membrane protease YdiL (CAAX protease family)
MAPLFVFSVALSLAYLWTGSLVAPVLMHAVFNAITLTMMKWAFDAV